MDTLSASLYFVVGILGVGYPILLQAISRLDDKYSSTLILDRFNEEVAKKMFVFFLIASVISLAIWCCHFPALLKIPRFQYIIDNSAEGISFVSTGVLVFFFFRLVAKIIRFYSPIAFAKYLIQKHNERKDSKDYKYFEAITEILIYSIRQQNLRIIHSIDDFIYASFKSVREEHGNAPVNYPEPMYDAVYELVEGIAAVNNQKLNFLANVSAGGVWLIGEFSDFKLSERSYQSLWTNLRLCLHYKNNDLVMLYWRNADQHFSVSLDLSNNQEAADSLYNDPEKKEFNQWVLERDRFLEFHYAFGGLLLYENDISCLTRIFNYTASIPPKYPLLPETMDEVFRWYFHFSSIAVRAITPIYYRYPFPRMEGQLASSIVQQSIIRYIGILFLRQYSLPQYFVNIDPTNLPNLPNTPSEIRAWIDELPLFQEIIVDLLKNEALLRELNLDFITEDWCQENKKTPPDIFVQRVLNRLQQLLEFQLIYQEISSEKAQEFYTATQQNLVPLFESLDKINAKKNVPNNPNTWVIRGNNTVMDKGAFAENQGISYMDAATVLPQSVANTFKTMVFRAFSSVRSVSYLLNREEYKISFSNLKLNAGKVALIAFNLNAEVLKKEPPYDTVDWSSFQIYFFYTGNEIRESSIFIINKEDLPSIIYREISQELVDKYGLRNLNEPFNLYASILDLHKSPHAIPQAIQSNPHQDTGKLVLLSIDFDIEINFKKQIPCVHLRLSSSYFEQGIPNNSSEIRKFE